MVYIWISKMGQVSGTELGEKPFYRDPPYPHRTSAHMTPHVAKPRLPQLENISMNDFQCQAVLGRGHFGKVKSQAPTRYSELTFRFFWLDIKTHSKCMQ